MASPFRPASLAPGTRFRVNGRTGTCYEIVGDQILVGWDEIIDSSTGVVSPETTDLLPTSEAGQLSRAGVLKILNLPENGIEDETARRNRVEIYKPESGATERALFRLSYIEAINRLIDEGVMPTNPRRQDIFKHLDDIEAMRRAIRRSRRKSSGGRTRAGGKEAGHIECECDRSIHDWWRSSQADPGLGVYDNYNRSGNRTARYTEEESDFFRGVIDEMLTQERPHLGAIFESVKAAVIVENDQRKRSDPPKLPLKRPGREFVTKLIKSISPVDFWTRSRGPDVAYRELHTLGEGPQLSRPMERVEIDEQTVDLMVLLRTTKVMDALGREGLAALAFDVTKARVTISAAIDCYTGCFVAFQVTNRPDQNLTKRTIEMIYLDKTDIAKAAGAISPWDAYGHPEELVMDKGATYISDANYLLLASSGITNVSLPGGHPFLKPWIEGGFRTLSSKLMPHLVGRTFKDVVAKGENDPKQRALVDIDTFLRLLTRWIVDVHHNTRPSRSGSRSPRERWERAMAEVPPHIRTDDHRLRKVFGQYLTRKISRTGITVGGVQYQSPELASWFAGNTQHDVDLWWWDRKVGAIEVRLPDGREITALCKDKRWAEASFADFQLWVDSVGDLNPEAELIAAKAMRDIDGDMLAMKRRLDGLLPLMQSDAFLRRREAQMQQFMRTRDQDRPDPRPLFGDEVDAGAPQEPRDSVDDAAGSAISTDPDDYSDILE